MNACTLDLLRLTDSEFQHWGSSSKATRDIKGVTELSGFKTRVREAAFSQKEGLA